MNKVQLLIILSVAMTFGCTTYRPIPVHGGGKRFDEEQRIISSSISNAVSQIKWERLAGKRIQLKITAMETSGGGELYQAGPESMLLMPEYQEYTNDTDRSPTHNLVDGNGLSSPYYGYTEKNTLDMTQIGGYLTHRFDPVYSNKYINTASDLKYLERVVTMFALCNDAVVVRSRADVVLNIMVNILGTNRSTADSMFYKKQTLRATCELTWYTEDAKSGAIVLAPEQIGGVANYSMAGIRFTNWYDRSYKTQKGSPFYFWGERGTSLEEKKSEPKEVVKTTRNKRLKKQAHFTKNKQLNQIAAAMEVAYE